MTTRSTGTRRPTPGMIPEIDAYPGGQTTPSPHAVDFTPGELLGSVSGELGLRAFLEAAGHTLVVTSDKDGPDSVFEREWPTPTS
jgi:formate dehydrogenase